MLVIRMQRTGRKAHAMFRVVVQDSRRTPSSGKVVARLGSYDPHTKTAVLDKDKAGFYLTNGAQPSDRAARLLKSEGVELPSWVKLSAEKKREVRNADKRRSTRPVEEKPTEEPAPETETPAEEAAEASEVVTDDSAEPAQDPAAEAEAAPTEENTEEPSA